MKSSIPEEPKVYHIVHVDRLPSIVAEGCLWCDSEVAVNELPGSTIGMNSIKERRLKVLRLDSHPDLNVGDCVPFYFCPRSVMLYLIYAKNFELSYKGGQGPIIHLESDLRRAVEWANAEGLRWAFTLSNAASFYFEDRCDLAHLDEIDWKAVKAKEWKHCRPQKQAEFLIEHRFPWELVSRIGVYSQMVNEQVSKALKATEHCPRVEIKRDWYY